MTQKGSHTWDSVIQYHGCPCCTRIIESRVDFQNLQGKYSKNLECPYCHHHFILIKSVKPRLGLVFGAGDVVELDWDEGSKSSKLK